MEELKSKVSRDEKKPQDLKPEALLKASEVDWKRNLEHKEKRRSSICVPNRNGGERTGILVVTGELVN